MHLLEEMCPSWYCSMRLGFELPVVNRVLAFYFVRSSKTTDAPESSTRKATGYSVANVVIGMLIIPLILGVALLVMQYFSDPALTIP